MANYRRPVPPPALQENDRINEFLEREEKRKSEELNARLLSCGFPPRLLNATFADYATNDHLQAQALQSCEAFSSAYQKPDPAPARGALFYGAPGTGKTHLACAIMRSVAIQYGVRYTTVSDLARAVRSTYHRKADDTEQDVLTAHISPSLLTIDEIGVGLGTDHERAMLHDVVAKRYDHRKPTILISNLQLDAVRAALGDRLVDRMREDNGMAISFSWPSYRGRA
jgi:DNA replication protein DnaC